MMQASKIGVAIVAPGGYPPDETAYQSALKTLEAQGCTVHNYYHPDSKLFRFSDTDQGRAEQLHRAAANPDVQIIMALRGGYGMSRLLPWLNFEMLAQSGKLFCGAQRFHGVSIDSAGKNRCP